MQHISYNLAWSKTSRDEANSVWKIERENWENLSDKRSTRSEIHEKFGDTYGFITDGLEEEDIYFTETRETMPEQSLRLNGYLQDLFEQDCKSGKVDKNWQLITFSLAPRHILAQLDLLLMWSVIGILQCPQAVCFL